MIKISRYLNRIVKLFRRLDRPVRLAVLGCVSIACSVLIATYSSTGTRRVVQKNVRREKAGAVHNDTVNKKVLRGESLYAVIVKHGGEKTEAVLVGKALKPFYNPRRIKVGDQYHVEISTAGKVRRFCLIPTPFDRFCVVKDNGEFKACRETIKISTRTRGVSGTIQSSLYESLIKKGVSPEVIVNFAEIFAWDIDFFNDPRNKDSYWLIWE